MANPPQPESGATPPDPPAAQVAPAVRQRLQKVFEHAQKCADKGDREYAHDLFTQCLVEDPGNLIYLQHFLGNLAQKYGGNKKGARFSGLKIKSARMSLSKAMERGNWPEVFQHGTAALKQNPWDTGTLILLAKACDQLDHHECQLYYLRWALDVDPKDANVNREAALALASLGHFEQAIGCWKRVEAAKPGDSEAAKQISRLSVDQTIQKGGYDQRMLSGEAAEATTWGSWTESAGAPPPAQGTPTSPADTQPQDEEQRLREAVEQNPAEVSHYLALAEYYGRKNRLPEAERVLTTALSAAGGDLRVRELLEDAQLRRVRQQLQVAQARAQSEATDEAKQLAVRMAAQANQAELEIYAARAAREPGSAALQYELGLRLKRAGKFREAIQAFQAARDDGRRQATVQIHLGECFQQIRQFKLAQTSYAAAVEASDSTDEDTQKLALYRAGVLSSELKDVERAEKFLTELAALDFGYQDVADRLDKLAAMRDSV